MQKGSFGHRGCKGQWSTDWHSIQEFRNRDVDSPRRMTLRRQSQCTESAGTIQCLQQSDCRGTEFTSANSYSSRTSSSNAFFFSTRSMAASGLRNCARHTSRWRVEEAHYRMLCVTHTRHWTPTRLCTCESAGERGSADGCDTVPLAARQTSTGCWLRPTAALNARAPSGSPPAHQSNWMPWLACRVTASQTHHN